MALIQKLISLDDLYSRTGRKIMLNDLHLTTENLKDLIYTTTGEKISLIPQCECGNLKNGYMLGKVCNICGTDVIRPFDNIEPLLWVRKFDDSIPFINPKLWGMLSAIISTKLDGLRWLSDTSYSVKTVPPVLLSIASVIGGRSYLNVINNIETIITMLQHHSSYKTILKATKLKVLLRIYKKSQAVSYSSYIPLINKKLFISETSNTGRYDTLLLADVIDLAMLAITVSNDVRLTQKKKEAATAKIISKSSKLFIDYIKDLVARKNGLARKNIYGTRVHFSFRAVVSSLSNKKRYDTIEVPWIVGVTTLRPFLINKLYGLGYTLKQADKMLLEACFIYNPLLDDLLKEMIASHPEKGLPILMNRNPTLGAGSIHYLVISKFKTDINDMTIGISKLIAKSLNLDYDGDSINSMLIIGKELQDLAKVFKPLYNVPQFGNYKVSGNLNLPKTQVMTLSTYFNEKTLDAKKCMVFDKIMKLAETDVLDLTK